MTLALPDAIHLLQELIDDLPGERIRTRTAADRGDGLDLIDEEDARRLPAGALEELPHLLAGLSHESGFEIRGAGGNERNAALIGERTRDLRLARARGTIKERALRYFEALGSELLDVTQRFAKRLQLLEGVLRQHERRPPGTLVDRVALRLGMPFQHLGPEVIGDRAALLHRERADIACDPGEVAAGQSGRQLGDEGGHLRRALELFHLEAQDLQPLGRPGQRDLDRGAEARHHGLIDQLAAVGGADDPDLLSLGAEAVPLSKEGLHDLLARSITSATPASRKDALAFVDENHAPSSGARLLPGLLDPLAALPDVARLQIRSLERHEGAARRVGDAPRDLRLPGAGRSIQEKALGRRLVRAVE